MTSLFDDFQIAWAQLAPSISADLQPETWFADLLWDSEPIAPVVLLERLSADPGVVVHGYSRWFVLLRIRDELRFYAGPLPNPWDARDQTRREAIQRESDERELGILRSVPEAACFAQQYLEGRRLSQISIARRAPGWT
ncbi:MAG: hypothetical protein HZA54_11025 [Planctomycetes bacterium]|nr:hypothetical protein [Planctomycetota bacterium]